MTIGIVPCLDEKAGGVYQYSMTLLEALLNLQKKLQDSFVIFTDDLSNPKLAKFKHSGWTIASLYKTTPFRQFVSTLIKNTPFEEIAAQILRIFRNRDMKSESINDLYNSSINSLQRDWFLSHKVDLMIYPSSNILSFKTMIPYIFAVHDLNHRIYREFPEVSAPDERKEREYVFKNGIKNATFILVDSTVGKEDVLRFYKDTNIAASRIKILPFLYANYIKDFSEIDKIEVRKLFKLPSEYIFYPAQFWPHKNHLRLVKALGILKYDYKLNIPLVLCGSSIGELRKKTCVGVMNESKQLNIASSIYYLGYVEDKFMPGLYKNAKALVMPTFFGPTNIPILEAWNLGCPVITSDLRGIRDQAGNGALLVDPRSIKSIALGIKKIWIDDKLKVKLITLGKERLVLYTKDDYNRRLQGIIEEAKHKIL